MAELDSATGYDEIQTFTDVQTVTAGTAAHSLFEFLMMSAGPPEDEFYVAYDISEEGLVTVD